MWTFIDVFIDMPFYIWFEGPFRRACVQPIIFSMGIVFTLFPVINFMPMTLLGFWAVADYYDYQKEWTFWYVGTV